MRFGDRCKSCFSCYRPPVRGAPVRTNAPRKGSGAALRRSWRVRDAAQPEVYVTQDQDPTVAPRGQNSTRLVASREVASGSRAAAGPGFGGHILQELSEERRNGLDSSRRRARSRNHRTHGHGPGVEASRPRTCALRRAPSPTEAAKAKGDGTVVDARVVTARGTVEAVDKGKTTSKGPKRSLTLETVTPRSSRRSRSLIRSSPSTTRRSSCGPSSPGQGTPGVSAQSAEATLKPGETPAGGSARKSPRPSRSSRWTTRRIRLQQSGDPPGISRDLSRRGTRRTSKS